MTLLDCLTPKIGGR